ncbi:MAG TPA: hypothetical protein VGR84_04375 [Candidatus Acidoferrales bacterium]|nr:hypothetical protein [Candidatus Acidoferrales bacterium]
MPRKPDSEERPLQQQTISVRISEALRARLDRAKELLSSKTGESVTTSDVAKQFLESAREDRMEVVELMAQPSETLLQIRRKGEAQHVLSRAEWTILAYFVQQGLEAFSDRTPNPVSRKPLTVVLDAFLAAYELRKERASKLDEFYLGNLPTEFRPAKAKGSDEQPTAETVRKAVLETRKHLSDPATKSEPLLAGRNLYVLLDEEKLSGAEALDRALRPSFTVLWRLAARGHYLLKHEPLRLPSAAKESFYQPPIPSVKEGDYSLSFARGEGSEFSLLLIFPGAHGPMYPISGYPRITEFRAMLASLPEGTRRWNGEHFFGYVSASEEGKGKEDVWFRAHANGITFGFSEKEWKSVQVLFRRAWEMPEVRMAWDELALEYGEL